MRSFIAGLALLGLLVGCRTQPQVAEASTPPSAVAAPPAAPPAPAAPAPAQPPPAANTNPITVNLTSFEAVGEFKDTDHFGYDDGNERMFYYSNGCAEAKVRIPVEGEYELVVEASCDEALNEFARFRVRVDGQAASGEVVLTSADPKDYKVALKLSAGEHKLGLEFTNDAWKEGEYDRNLFIHRVTLKRLK